MYINIAAPSRHNKWTRNSRIIIIVVHVRYYAGIYVILIIVYYYVRVVVVVAKKMREREKNYKFPSVNYNNIFIHARVPLSLVIAVVVGRIVAELI